jgi:hypothetical protein
MSCRAADVGRIASQLSPVGKAEVKWRVTEIERNSASRFNLLAVRQHPVSRPIFAQDGIIISGCSNLSHIAKLEKGVHLGSA